MNPHPYTPHVSQFHLIYCIHYIDLCLSSSTKYRYTINCVLLIFYTEPILHVNMMSMGHDVLYQPKFFSVTNQYISLLTLRSSHLHYALPEPSYHAIISVIQRARLPTLCSHHTLCSSTPILCFYFTYTTFPSPHYTLTSLTLCCYLLVPKPCSSRPLFSFLRLLSHHTVPLPHMSLFILPYNSCFYSF